MSATDEALDWNTDYQRRIAAAYAAISKAEANPTTWTEPRVL